MRDAWEDDDRVGRLLARRAAEQEAERRAAVERYGDGARPAATQLVQDPPARARQAPGTAPSSDTGPSSTTGLNGTGREAERRAAARTTTVPALEPRGATEAPQRTVADGVVHAPRSTVAPAKSSARIVCIASGKGGTGKSVVATNLALQRAKRGERVLLIDFDAGLANDHLLLGLAPPYDIGHVMTGEVAARDALVEGPLGIKLLAGGVGRQVMIDPTRRELDRLFKALKPLESEFDLILVDHGAGLSYSTVAHLAATSTLILVTNHEVTALSDGYALYKRAHMVNHAVRVGLVINRVPDERIALGAWERFRGAAHKFLGHTPELIGWVPVDPAVPQAVQMRSPVTLSFPDCAAVEALERVAAWGPIDHARSATAFYDRARRALR
ncbi:MAG: AAA family ATPase [Planctomycetota bacterium]